MMPVAVAVVAMSLAFAVSSGLAISAENYPNRPIRLIVPTAPGGAPDIVARIVGQKLTEQLQRQVVVDTRPGASGVIGVELAKRAAPDGYTLLLVASAQFGSLPALKNKLTYKPDEDFVALSRIAWWASVVCVNAELGVNSVADLVKLAKAKPGQLSYGSAGNGSPAHLAGAMLNVLASINSVHVPYKGASLAMIDLITGQVQFLITSPAVAMPQARAGHIKMLATTGAQRDPFLPELPVVGDTVPGYNIVQWLGIAVPAGTPQAIVKRLHNELMTALNTQDVRELLRKNGATPKPELPAEFVAFMKAERERIGRIGKQAGITLE